MLSKIILSPVLLPFFCLGLVVYGVVIFLDWLFSNIGWAFHRGMMG
jgi:hypothetical protein